MRNRRASHACFESTSETLNIDGKRYEHWHSLLVEASHRRPYVAKCCLSRKNSTEHFSPTRCCSSSARPLLYRGSFTARREYQQGAQCTSVILVVSHWPTRRSICRYSRPSEYQRRASWIETGYPTSLSLVPWPGEPQLCPHSMVPVAATCAAELVDSRCRINCRCRLLCRTFLRCTNRSSCSASKRVFPAQGTTLLYGFSTAWCKAAQHWG